MTRGVKPPPMLEKDWQRTVIDCARKLGWMVAHFRPGLNQRGRWMTAVAGDGAGFPDLTLVHEKTGDLLLVELKRDSTKLKPEQERWGRAIQAGDPARWQVWRPRDWTTVKERLMNPRRAA